MAGIDVYYLCILPFERRLLFFLEISYNAVFTAESHLPNTESDAVCALCERR